MLIQTDRDVLDLDMAKYEALSHMPEFLDPGFKQNYEYPIGSFLFKPLAEVRLYSYENVKDKHNQNHHFMTL